MATTAPDIITLKIEKIFNALDTDHNGYVEWSDFQQLVDRLLTEYRLDRGDRRATALHAGYAMFWQELARHADANGDQRISKDEYIAAARASILDNSRFDSVDGLSNVLFDVIDVNGDNEIDKSEFARFLGNVWGVPAPDTAQAFAALDTDGDGRISRSEFVRAAREFFMSNDPAAPGGRLFGAV
ncbi:EF-hand domain-containing protein [Kitasatospora sp. NPDC088351]|uniref:EF-hand domain-containing protein n=1 Tax=unclassified Kitasatospora TaxID=2633591 RepID=UPI0034499CFC